MWDDSVGKVKTKRNRQNKPYDRPKSLLRRVTDSVTGLLPQPSWLSSWLGSDKSESEENDVVREEELVVFTSKTIQNKLSGKAALNSTSNSFGQESFIYSRPAYAQPVVQAQRGTENQANGNVILDDSLPGPSGLHLSQHPMASTPAPTPEKSGCTPTAVKEDESNSESTSGCSSLVPHPDKKDPQASLSRPGQGSIQNLDGSIARSLASQVSKPSALASRSKTDTGALSKGRKCLNLPCSNIARATSDATQDPEESIQDPNEKQFSTLIMDRSTSYIEPQASALSSKRPRFSISAFGSPPQAKDGASAINSILHSPFYAGKTTYGGASAYRRARLNATVPYNASNRQQVQVKNKGPVVLSSTAQRILEALESMSTPIRDAKKIPTPAKTAPFSSARLSETSKSAAPDDTFAGFGGGLLSWSQRRRPKLSSTIVSAPPSGPPVGKLTTTTPVRVEKLPPAPHPSISSTITTSEISQSAFGGGKMRAKVTAPVRETLASKAEREDRIEEDDYAIPDLPNIPLPIKNLPTFSLPFAPQPTARSSSLTVASVAPVPAKSMFTFSAPIQEAEFPASSVHTLSVKLGFKFSAPISALDQNGLSSSSPLSATKVSSLKVADPPQVAPTPKRVSFGITGDDEATPSKGTWTAKELVSGTVMDVLRGKKDERKANTGFGDAFKPKAGAWECSSCMVRNDAGKEKCVACETPKPGSKPAFTATKPFSFSTPTTAHPKSALPAPIASSTPFAGFGSQFKPSAEEWECSVCMIRNKKDATKCAACETSKPGPIASKSSATSATVPTKSFTGFGDKFKPAADQWECSVCMVRNKSGASKCVACETLKPGATKPEASAVNSKAANQTMGFGDKFKPAADTWECSICMVRNKINVNSCVSCESPKPGTLPIASSAPFKFGVKGTDVSAAATSSITSAFKFGVPSTNTSVPTPSTVAPGGFKFGVPSTEPTASALPTTGFKFGVAASGEGKEGESAAPIFKFGAAAPKASEETQKSSTESSQGESTTPTFTFGAGKNFLAKPKASETSVETPAALKPSSELKMGSVMDILGGKKTVEVAATTLGVVVPSPVASFTFGSAAKPTEAPVTVPTTESKTTPVFSFGAAATTAPVPATTSLPLPAQTLPFSFGTPTVAKLAEPKASPSFTFSGASTKRGINETGDEPVKKALVFGQPAIMTTPSLITEAPPPPYTSLTSNEQTSTAGSLFAFGAAAAPAPASTFTFGANAASTQSTTTPVFSFGAKDAAKPGPGLGAPAEPVHSISPSVFGAPARNVSSIPGFAKPEGTTSTPTTAAPPPYSFGSGMKITTSVSSNPIFSFGSTYASANTGPPGFGFGTGATARTVPTTSTSTAQFGSTGFGGFGSPAPATTAQATTASSTLGGFGFPASTGTTGTGFGGFGAPASTSSGPAFGGFGAPASTTTSTGPAFGGFGGGTSTSTAAAPAFGGFGAAASTTASGSTPIFSFGGATKPVFGASPAPSPVFGTPASNQPSGGLGFGAPAATTAAVPAPAGGYSFGTHQAPPSFATTPSFTFGQSQPQPAAQPAGIFHFGGQQSATPNAGGFGFGASAPAPAPVPGGFAFNPSAPPSFAFGGGAAPAPANFSANPFDATGSASGVRRIRKATRRTGR